ncbi:hypothetical protein THAOC_29364, partial [Thalassiosira oceanica]
MEIDRLGISLVYLLALQDFVLLDFGSKTSLRPSSPQEDHTVMMELNRGGNLSLDRSEEDEGRIGGMKEGEQDSKSRKVLFDTTRNTSRPRAGSMPCALPPLVPHRGPPLTPPRRVRSVGCRSRRPSQDFASGFCLENVKLNGLILMMDKHAHSCHATGDTASMRLSIGIRGDGISSDIVLHVGTGSQNVKWLANAASYRLYADRLRARNLQHALKPGTALLPKAVYSDDLPFVHPSAVISDTFEDGESVTVVLYAKPELDEYSCPILSPFAKLAFCHDEAGKEERERIAEEKRVEVEQFTEDRIAEQLRARLAEEKPKLALMSKILEEQISPCESVFERSFALIKDSGILDNIVPDAAQQRELRKFFAANFVELSDLYKFYAAVNSGGQTHTLEFIEFSQFLSETGLLESNSSAMQRIFIDSHIRRGRGKPSISSAIRKHEFFISIVKISILKKITLPRRELAALRRQGKAVGNGRPVMPTPPEATKLCFEEYLSPILANMPAGSKMRNSISTKEVLILLHNNLEDLSAVFRRYVESDGDENSSTSSVVEEDSVPNGAITVSQFELFAQETGFADGNTAGGSTQMITDQGTRKMSVMGQHSSTQVSARDIRQIFSASQNDAEDEAVLQK